MRARHASLLPAVLLGAAAVVLLLGIAARGGRRAASSPGPASVHVAAGKDARPVLLELEERDVRQFRAASRVGLAGEPARHAAPRPDPRAARRRNATLAGRLTRGAEPLAGVTLELSAGLNRGRRILVGPDGRFLATDLYPGFARVLVGTGGSELERELALRPNVESRLELDLEGGVFVMGRVVDSGGEGIPRAEVRLDGAPVRCDGLGRFQGSTGASGRGWIEVTCAGYAPTRVELAPPRAAPDGLTPLPEPLEIVLAPACRLEVELELSGTHADPPRVLVIPDRGLRAPSGRGAYPWSRLGALEAPGGHLVLEDLPPGDVRVLAFQDDSRERSVSLRLDPRQPARVTLRLRPPASARAASERDTLDPQGKLLLALGEDVGEVFTRPLDGL